METFESSQKCPESLDCFLSQTTKFLINPFTRRCTLTNFQGGGTRNPQGDNSAVCLRVGNCKEQNGQGSLPRRKPCCSQIKPEMSRISGLLLSQTTKFLINPFTRRCTLTNFQGGGTRNPQEGNNAVCLRVGNCEENMARAACQEESPAVLRQSQKCPESLDCFLSQTTKFLINPFTRRCTLTNFQGGGTRNPQEGNNAVCLRVGNCEKNMARAACQEEEPRLNQF